MPVNLSQAGGIKIKHIKHTLRFAARFEQFYDVLGGSLAHWRSLDVEVDNIPVFGKRKRQVKRSEAAKDSRANAQVSGPVHCYPTAAC